MSYQPISMPTRPRHRRAKARRAHRPRGLLWAIRRHAMRGGHHCEPSRLSTARAGATSAFGDPIRAAFRRSKRVSTTSQLSTKMREGASYRDSCLPSAIAARLAKYRAFQGANSMPLDRREHLAQASPSSQLASKRERPTATTSQHCWPFLPCARD